MMTVGCTDITIEAARFLLKKYDEAYPNNPPDKVVYQP